VATSTTIPDTSVTTATHSGATTTVVFTSAVGQTFDTAGRLIVGTSSIDESNLALFETSVSSELGTELTDGIRQSLSDVADTSSSSKSVVVSVEAVTNDTSQMMFEYIIRGLTPMEASDVATYISPRNVSVNGMSHYTCHGGGVNRHGVSSGGTPNKMQSAVSMQLQNILKYWGCWSVGGNMTALPTVRHVGATEHPFVSNARGPEHAVDGNINGFGEQYLSQTAPEQQPWWEIDLGRNRTIHQIVIWLPTQPNEILVHRTVPEAPIWLLLASDTPFPVHRHASLNESIRSTCGVKSCTQRFAPASLIEDGRGRRYIWNIESDSLNDASSNTNTTNTTSNIKSTSAATSVGGSTRSARYLRIQLESHVVAIPVVKEATIILCRTWNMSINARIFDSRKEIGTIVRQPNGRVKWDVRINSQTITAASGSTVTQAGSNTGTGGTLTYALTGDEMVNVTITSPLGEAFDTQNDLIIEDSSGTQTSTTIAQSNLVSVYSNTTAHATGFLDMVLLGNGAEATFVTINAASGVSFDANTELVLDDGTTFTTILSDDVLSADLSGINGTACIISNHTNTSAVAANTTEDDTTSTEYTYVTRDQVLRLAEVQVFMTPSVSVEATWHSTKLVSCTVPPQASSVRDQFVNVRILNRHYRPLEGSNRKRLLYKQTPLVFGLSRQRVHVSGGLPISVYGTGFVNTTDTDYDLSRAAGHFAGPLPEQVSVIQIMSKIFF
jgi:hypothetical protein